MTNEDFVDNRVWLDVKLSKKELHECRLLGSDTVKICQMQGFNQRLENENQSRDEANQLGFMAEYAVAKLFGLEKSGFNVISDGGVDLWWGDATIEVKYTKSMKLLFDRPESFAADYAVLVTRLPDKETFRFLGWVDRDTFMKNWKPYSGKFGERMSMASYDLLPPEKLWLELRLKELSKC